MHGEKINLSRQLLALFIPAYPFLFFALDRAAKYYALISGTSTLSPHFLSFSLSVEVLIWVGATLIGLFIFFYAFSLAMPVRGRFSFLQYLYADFSAHALIIGSVSSNIYDLIRHGGIIDWIDIGIAKTNLADIGIVFGICLLFWRGFKSRFSYTNFE